MPNKISKKGRNPGAVDTWLDSLGLYRKNVAYDETCMFRAVSEQLFDCQIFHERVRRECLEYGRANFSQFQHLMDDIQDWLMHLDKLEHHMVVCGEIEMQLISYTYERNVYVFDATSQMLLDKTKRELPDAILLCLMDEGHYDVVYKRDLINTAGFCQSLVYKALYENVFGIPNVDAIVNAMLYEKPNPTEAGEPGDEDAQENYEPCFLNPNPNTNIAPFPFKVAKALDPMIYRNIEYDSWGDVRREMRLGEWYYGDNRLIMGTKCMLKDKNETHECYIQKVLKEENKCFVYLTRLAERRLVSYDDLLPENDAKPWPLPYRFAKNVSGTSVQVPVEKITKTTKKRIKGDRKSTKSLSECSLFSNNAASSETTENVNSYVGVSLKMNGSPSNTKNFAEPAQQNESKVDEPETPSTPGVLVTPELAPPTPSGYQWEQPQWHYIPPSPEPFLWPETPTTPQNIFNFNVVKPMVASAPVTPDVVPYHDNNYPFYFNFHVDPYNNQFPPNGQYVTTPIGGQYMTPPTSISYMPSPTAAQYVPPGPATMVTPTLPPNNQIVSKRDANAEEAAEPENEEDSNQNGECPPPPPPGPGRLAVRTNLYAPPVDMYPQMVPVYPGTPVVYTPVMPDMMMPTTPIMYGPPPMMDMQYVPTGQYVYPPTPPAAWYPAGTNAQGFIFPNSPLPQ